MSDGSCVHPRGAFRRSGSLRTRHAAAVLTGAALLAGAAFAVGSGLVPIAGILLDHGSMVRIPRLDLKNNRVLVEAQSGPRIADLAVPDPEPPGVGSPVQADGRGISPRGVATGDFAANGSEALAVSDFSGARVVLYRFDSEAGSALVPVQVLRVPAGPRGILAADLDRDGRVDLAVASAIAQRVTIFLGRGGFTFERTQELSVDGIPVEVKIERAGRASRSPVHAAEMLVTLAEGGVLRLRPLGGGVFNPDPRMVDASNELDTAPPGGVVSADRVAVQFATPTIDFDQLRSCVATLPIPAAKIDAATAKVDRAEILFAAAAAGTNIKKFARSAKRLNRYIAIIQSQVGVTTDQPTADVCIVPAGADVDRILLIGAPASIAIESGDGQTGRPFEKLAASLTAHVEDVYTNGVPKVPVSFAVASGVGTVAPVSVMTDASGNASASLTLGAPPDGDITVVADGGVANTVIFSEHKVTGTISLASDVQRIFTASCALSGCHAGSNPQVDQDLSAGNLFDPSTGIVNVDSHEAPGLKRVQPGDSGASYLVNKIEGTQKSVGGNGAQMPRGRGPLSQANRFLIKTWIDQGAQNN